MITTVDIGATKTLIAQFGEDGKPRNQVKFPTPPEKEDFFTELTKQLEAFRPITTLSVGVPGIVRDGIVDATSNLVWRYWPLQQILQEKYDCPVYIQNDANMAAVGEINALGTPTKLAIYLTVSTGIGCGLVMDGKLPSPTLPTEFGTGLVYYDGKWQSWEHLASGRALVKHFGKKAQDLNKPEEWEWLAGRLALGLAVLIPAFEPEYIVFGGGVGKYFDKFKEPLEAALHALPLSEIPTPILKPAQHAEEAVIYGCYYYAVHNRAA